MTALIVAIAFSLTAATRLSAETSTPSPAPTAAASDAAVTLQLQYEVYYSLLRLVTIESRTRVEPDVYSLESHMETVGLIARRNSGQGYYDRFRDRVQFPIRDVNGRAVAAVSDRYPEFRQRSGDRRCLCQPRRQGHCGRPAEIRHRRRRSALR